MRRPALSRARLGVLLRLLGLYAVACLVVALVAVPVVLERSVEQVSLRDELGTLPVEMSLCRDGRSTLETGILGDVFWDETGAFGFGVRARVLEPPQAGGTLASYVDPEFIDTNVQFVGNPDAAVGAYAREFRDRIVADTRRTVLVVALGGGLLLTWALRGWATGSGAAGRGPTRRQVLASVVTVAVVTAGSVGLAAFLFDRWDCNDDPRPGLPLADVPGLSFSSPQTLELARQVRPFIEKNTQRLAERGAQYVDDTEGSFVAELDRLGGAVAPREGEVLVLAEADPQGSLVGSRVRVRLVEALVERLGADAVALRTISGDVTSNGTVGEAGFVALEASVGGEDVPTAAVSGDHDSEITESQLRANGVTVLDTETAEVGGLRVSGANDVERKALFGALVTNDSGITEYDLGVRLREAVDEDRAQIVLLHQPTAVAGYLGVNSIAKVRELDGSLTEPYDDGIPDVPPGTVNIGHLHDFDGPWVLWNTDTEDVTWTVVDQLATSGGVEEAPTFNRFSTPVSLPLKDMGFRLQYVDTETGLQTGWATVTCDPDAVCTVSDRTDVGLPLDQVTDRATDRATDRPSDRATDRAADRTADRPGRADR